MHFNGEAPLKGGSAIGEMYGERLPRLETFRAETNSIEVAPDGEMAWETGSDRRHGPWRNGDHRQSTSKFLIVWRKKARRELADRGLRADGEPEDVRGSSPCVIRMARADDVPGILGADATLLRRDGYRFDPRPCAAKVLRAFLRRPAWGRAWAATEDGRLESSVTPS